MAEPQKDTPEVVTPQPTSAAVVGTTDTSDPLPAPPAEAPREPDTPRTGFMRKTPEENEEASATTERSLTWSASEFHGHEKSASWYMLLALATIVASAILYFLTKSKVTPVVVVISGIVLGIFGTHKPGELQYAMDRHGIHIGSKQYSYSEFRLVVVTPQSIAPEVMLIPNKRFMPSLSLRYTPEVKDEVLNLLADHLPFEERRLDLVDNIMQRIRF